MTASPFVTRNHRIAALLFGVVVGLNVAILGFFLDTVVAMAVSGLFVGLGVYLLVPVFVHLSETGGVPPPTSEAVFGTGLNPAALGVGLEIGGLGILFASFVFENILTVVGVGLGAVLVVYVFLAWLIVVRDAAVADETLEEAERGINTTGVLSAGAGFVGYQGVVAVSDGATGSASVLFVVAVVLLLAALRSGGYF